MQGRGTTRALFTKKFFEVAELPADEVIRISFPLPTDVDTLQLFLTKDGEEFRAGVQELVRQLRSWALEQDVLGANGDNALESFLQRFNYSGTNPENNELIFSLYSRGVVELATIVHLLSSGKKALEAKKENY